MSVVRVHNSLVSIWENYSLLITVHKMVNIILTEPDKYKQKNAQHKTLLPFIKIFKKTVAGLSTDPSFECTEV